MYHVEKEHIAFCAACVEQPLRTVGFIVIIVRYALHTSHQLDNAVKQAVLPVDDTDLEAILTALPTALTTSRQECLEECGLTPGGDGELVYTYGRKGGNAGYLNWCIPGFFEATAGGSYGVGRPIAF